MLYSESFGIAHIFLEIVDSPKETNKILNRRQRSPSLDEWKLFSLLFLLLFYSFGVVLGVVFMELGHIRCLPMDGI